MVLSLTVAVTAFLVLTSSARTTSLELTRTVDANFRSSYDLLVRPQGSRTPLESAQGLVRPNYLSGIYGGISLRQLAAVQRVMGVEVAAPIAMVGTIFETVQLPVDVTRFVGGRGRVLLRFRTEFTSQRGLATSRGSEGYVYVTPSLLTYNSPMSGDPPYGDQETTGRRRALVCPDQSDHPAGSPFSPRADWQAWCWSRGNGLGGQGWQTVGVGMPGLRPGRFGALIRWVFPVTLAAIDPDAEAELTGIKETMVDGRFLQADDTPVKNTGDADISVPVIVAAQPLVDETASVRIEALPAAVANRLSAGVSAATARRMVTKAPGRLVGKRTMSAQFAYEAWRQSVRYQTSPPLEAYWTAEPVTYRQWERGLRPVEVENPNSIWRSQLQSTGYVPVPADAAGSAFRRLTQHSGVTLDSMPRLDAVGTFDPAQLKGFSKLSEVPLETYQPPSVVAGDAKTRQLLGGRQLLPGLNPAGYLQAPPLVLTSLEAVPAFTSSGRFRGASAGAPISVIRVRVAGVTGTDAESQERIRLVAERIRERTGLDVDVTVGSSPAPTAVVLPPTHEGTPELRVTENWVKKGVALALVNSIDKKSALLFLLILLTSGLVVATAANASIRQRRVEFGILACIGWRPITLYRSVCAELVAIGLLSGFLGTALAFFVGAAAGVPVSVGRAALALPVAGGLALLAGFIPAWRASQGEPLAAVRRVDHTVRRAHRMRGVGSLAIAALRRTPGRVLAGAAALGLGVAAITLLTGIIVAFRGAAVGTLLGDVIVVQVRGADVAAALVMVVLALISLTDILFLDVREQAPHYACLQACGWRDSALVRLILTQAAFIAVLGACAGATLALLILTALAVVNTTVLLTATMVGCLGVLLAVGACLAPATALLRQPTAELLAREE